MPINVILGSGISGLIASQFVNNPLIISKGESSFAEKINVPQIIHYSASTYQFLRRFFSKKELTTKSYKVGYFWNGKTHSKCPAQLVLSYYRKSRNIENDVKYSIEMKEASTVMTGRKSIFKGFTVTIQQLAERIYNDIHWTNDIVWGNVVKIDTKKNAVYFRTSTGMRTIFYNNLISTIPANIFFKLAGFNLIARQFKYADITILKLPRESDVFGNLLSQLGYDYIYFPSEEFPFYRANFLHPGWIVYEFSQPQRTLTTCNAIRNAQMTNDVEVEFKMPANTYALGRFAEWKHEVKVNETIDRAQEIAKVINKDT